jgi:predicted dienelactone hydrolase
MRSFANWHKSLNGPRRARDIWRRQLPFHRMPLAALPRHRHDDAAVAVLRGWRRRLMKFKHRLSGAALALALAGPAAAQVGMERLDLPGLPVTLVYPSNDKASLQQFGPFGIEVAPGAALAPGAARRLVVLSHGSGGSPLADHALAATLARAGFVVAQPLHAGDNALDFSQAGPVAWQRRPDEVRRVIDALADHPSWRSRLQLDRVGVHGMSAGGVSALALAGAQWRLADMLRHCAARGDDDPGFCFYGALDPASQAERRSGFERMHGVPDSALPPAATAAHGGRTPPADATGFDPRPDPRVAAVTLAVPVAAIFGADSLARIRVPLGVVGADRDTLLLPAWHSDHVLRNCKRCTPLATLRGAGHFDALAPWPAALAEAVAATQVRGGRPEPGFDALQRQQAFEAIAAFHRQHLDQD